MITEHRGRSDDEGSVMLGSGGSYGECGAVQTKVALAQGEGKEHSSMACPRRGDKTSEKRRAARNEARPASRIKSGHARQLFNIFDYTLVFGQSHCDLLPHFTARRLSSPGVDHNKDHTGSTRLRWRRGNVTKSSTKGQCFARVPAQTERELTRCHGYQR